MHSGAGRQPLPGSQIAAARGVSIARLCGIADEAGSSLEAQISAHVSLGWSRLELRSVDGVPIGSLPAGEMQHLAAQLDAAGMAVSVLDSRIGSWSTCIENDFAADRRELQRLLPLARQLDCGFIRVMSYPASPDTDPEFWRAQTICRMRELARLAADQGIQLLHENCHGWAACDPERAIELLEAVQFHGLALLFDIGNPVAHGYDGLAYLARVLPWVAHIHVKDATTEATGGTTFVGPGAGASRLLECIDLALSSGYPGQFSIEPHVAVRPHDAVRERDAAARTSYIDYGRRFMALLGERLSRPDLAP